MMMKSSCEAGMQQGERTQMRGSGVNGNGSALESRCRPGTEVMAADAAGHYLFDGFKGGYCSKTPKIPTWNLSEVNVGKKGEE